MLKAQNQLKSNPLLFYKSICVVLCAGLSYNFVIDFCSKIYATVSSGPNLSLNSILLIIVILSFLGLIVSLGSFLYMQRSLQNIAKDRMIEKQEKYQQYFAGVVSAIHNDNIQFEKYVNADSGLEKEDLVEPENREILLKELKSVHSIIKSSEKARLKELYLGFGFIEDLKSKLQSPYWVKRVEAINEIKQFDLSDFYSSVNDSIRDSNINVQKSALALCLDINENPIEVLLNIRSPIGKWETHLFVKALEKRPKQSIPIFSDYIDEYPEHIEFLDNMSRYYKQWYRKEPTTALHVVA